MARQGTDKLPIWGWEEQFVEGRATVGCCSSGRSALPRICRCNLTMLMDGKSKDTKHPSAIAGSSLVGEQKIATRL
jgi:hypothetical protein